MFYAYFFRWQVELFNKFSPLLTDWIVFAFTSHVYLLTVESIML